MIWKPRRDGGAVATLPDGRTLEEQLREAAQARRFHLHYQPVVAVADGALIGVEALLRWDSDQGPVSPARFVPVLEATGLIGPVGEWVLAEACAELSAWGRPEGAGLLSVNVSA